MKLLPIILASAIGPVETDPKTYTAYEWRQTYVCFTGDGNWFERGRCPATPVPWRQLAKGPGEGDNEASRASTPDASSPAPVDRSEICE